MSTAVFYAEELYEIHRDPGGHYHHWSILTGDVKSGTLRIGDYLAIPTVDDSPCVARIGGFEVFRRVMGDSLSAGEHDVPVGIMVTKPAPPRSIFRRGDAVHTTEDAWREAALYALEHAPERLFHTQGDTDFACPECSSVLTRIPESRPLLEALAPSLSPASVRLWAERLLGPGTSSV